MTTTDAPAKVDGERIGPFVRGEPVRAWGGGFFVARKVDESDERARFIVQRAFGSEAPALAREGAWRRAHPHANTPSWIDQGTLPDGSAWLAYAGAAAIPIEHAMGVFAVPVVLSWARELVDVMLHHARCASESGHSVELRPAFSDLLVTRDGALLVLTAPSQARTWHGDLLRTSRLNTEMRAPELGMLKHEPIAAQLDVFAVGAFLHLMLRERSDDPRRDISTRTAQLVQRAHGPLAARHESLDELAHDLRACLDEFPALDPTDRARAVRDVAAAAMANAEKELIGP